MLACDVTPDLHQPYGIVHGGVHCSLVESAASIGAALWFGERGNGSFQWTHARCRAVDS